MTEREALKLALEALEVANSCVDGYYIPKGKTHLPEVEQAITAIKEALAQPEQEFVAYIDMSEWPPVRFKEGTLRCDIAHLDGQKLYTTPPQRKPLTDEELRAIENKINPNMRWRSSDEEGITFYPSEYYELIQAIEAAHGIKE